MSSTLGRAGAILLALAMLIYCTMQMRVVSNIESFMPRGGTSELAAISRGITSSQLTRSMVMTIGSEQIDASVKAAKSLADALRTHPEVAWLRIGADAEQLESAYSIYFPRRHALLASDPRRLDAWLSDDGLRDRAQRLRAELARPSGSLIARIAGEDPLLAFPALVERLTSIDRRLAMREGVFVTSDAQHAVLFLTTRHSPFESIHQRPLLESIDAEFAKIDRASASALTLEMAGVNRFALDIEDSIRGEIPVLFAISTLGVALLFFAFFGSFNTLWIGMLPHAAGVLCAATFGLAVFGHLNGLAIAFGISLIGVSIDYAIHLLTHHGFASEGAPARATAAKIRPSLLLGGATTVASFVGLAFANFPGFYQMGILATVGVVTALGVSLFVLPALLSQPTQPRIAARTATTISRRAIRLGQQPAFSVVAIALAVAAGSWGIPRITWVDDLQALANLDSEIEAEERRVRARVTKFDANRFLVALGPDLETALARNDRLYTALERITGSHALAGFRSLHPLLPSAELQRANAARLRADPTLPDRLSRVFTDVGFAPGAFSGFATMLANDAPEPLQASDLIGSPLEAFMASMRIDVDDQVGIVTYLEGIEDAAQINAVASEIEGVQLFDRGRFFDEVYGEYRERIVAVVVSGFGVVLLLLFFRYRAFRPALAAFLPSILVAGCLAGLAPLLGVEVSVLHLIGLILVLGMGVDYGVFMVDSHGRDEELGITLLSLMISCVTTLFVFGVMGFSEHPVLNAIGRTTGFGVALALAFAPVSISILGVRKRTAVSPT